MRLIYEKQAVIDDVDIHAAPHNIPYNYKCTAVIRCECDQMLWNLTSWKVSLRSDSIAKEPS